ncbi:protein kinase domain-containing protein [Labedaea rhizosphaerae]|uniref:non-specific serine/threonine protein kinase n=1 Tax=Labedaea rhizosphaerae TaxID=598644 RepID=A0A4R6SMM5_LABRH|nr:protein kinase [Labedaea rhizosphaerae]TDQ05141.1 serine/threonine-protein kinase [Labedaea rhizosphaerae]
MLTSGQLLADRYRLVRRIAVGGMGEVWKAADTRLDRTVAIKVLKPELCGDAEFLHRFRTEARTTSSLNHPGIVAVHDYGETAAIPDGPQDTAYLVMEMVEGDPLAAILAKEGRISAERTLDILEQAGIALQAAHERGYVHRDVKPGNILITPTGKVKLTDFGIAKAADAAPVTRSGMVMGTAHYIAPEQALGHEASPASDVYSLAVVGYECLAGHRPFLSENAVTVAMMHIRDVPPPLPPDVPPGARAVIDATLVKDPRQRYANGAEFAAAVAAVRAGMPLPAPSGVTYAAAPMAAGHTGTQPRIMVPPGMSGPPTTGSFQVGMPPPQRRGPNRTALWVLLTVGLVLIIILLVWAIMQASDDGGGRGGGSGGDTPVTQTTQAGAGASDTQEPGGTPGETMPGGSEPGGSGGPGGPGGGDVVHVDADDYKGRSAFEVEHMLSGGGLEVGVMPKNADPADVDLRRCIVYDVTPEGDLQPGTQVTIECAVTKHEGPPN